jgi:hypothetical protein
MRFATHELYFLFQLTGGPVTFLPSVRYEYNWTYSTCVRPCFSLCIIVIRGRVRKKKLNAIRYPIVFSNGHRTVIKAKENNKHERNEIKC